MAGNSIGNLFKITTFGESHGGAVGVIVDGVTPGVDIVSTVLYLSSYKNKPIKSIR